MEAEIDTHLLSQYLIEMARIDDVITNRRYTTSNLTASIGKCREIALHYPFLTEMGYGVDDLFRLQDRDKREAVNRTYENTLVELFMDSLRQLVFEYTFKHVLPQFESVLDISEALSPKSAPSVFAGG